MITQNIIFIDRASGTSQQYIPLGDVLLLLRCSRTMLGPLEYIRIIRIIIGDPRFNISDVDHTVISIDHTV